MNKSSLTHLPRTLLASLIVVGVILTALGLPQIATATPWYVRDQFDNAAYANNNGSVNWVGNWTEQGDDNNATSGEFLVSGNWLRIQDTDNNTANEGVYRVVNLASASSATLSFYYRNSNNLENTDTVVVEISNDSGTTYPSVLFTSAGVNQANSTRYTVTIPSAYFVANARLRFRVSNDYSAGEYFEFDNIEVAYTVGGTHTSTSVLQYVQIYYVPVTEIQALKAMVEIENGGPSAAPVSPTYVYVSISINSDNTVIFYDHWEDGYEPAVNDPLQRTTDVWGDNNPANGIPPGFTTDILNGGDIIIVNNKVDVDTTWPATRPIKYDGGDKIAATQAIAVTRTSWASGTGTLHGGSVEMLDTSVWGTRFDMPGDYTLNPTVQTPLDYRDFGYAALAVMANENGTNVYRNGNLVTTLNEGGSYLFENIGGTNSAAANYILMGDRITTNAGHPIQANVMAGTIASNYQSDWLTLYPYTDVDGQPLLSSSYYSVVPSFAAGTPLPEAARTTRVYLENPNASSITVYYQGYGDATSSTISVAAYSTNWVTLSTTADKGMHFWTTGTPAPVFQAVSLIDSEGQASDWGYTLIPSNQLTQQAQVGWGYGQDPTLPDIENASPVWVAAIGTGAMNVCADYNGDRAGALTDANGLQYDQLLTLNNLQQAKVYDTDGNQTGMLLYLCNGSETANNKGNKIAVAWGQDPTRATAGAPGLDVGTTVPPLPNYTAVKGAHLTDDSNGNGNFDVGETFEYQIRINNTGALPVPADLISVEDIVPQYTLYVPGSANIYSSYTDLTTAIADNSVPPAATVFPLDEGGVTIDQQLRVDNYFIVNFRVRINADLPGATNIVNNALVSGLNLSYDPNVEIIVQPPDQTSRVGDTLWLDLNGNGIQEAGELGLQGVTVELRDGTCTPGVTCLTDVTDASGIYSFPNLPNGTYTVAVRSATLPAGLAQTGDPDQPGVLCTICDGEHTLTLTNANRPYLAADFGYQGNVTLGDFVWNDLNSNGIQDSGETGVSGATVNLTWAGLDGNLATTADNLNFSTVTSLYGAYSFTHLPAGVYTLEFVTPSGYNRSPQDQGGNDATDSDASDTTGFTGAYTLASGETNNTIDAGFIYYAALSIAKTSSAGGLVNPGDTIQYTIQIVNNTATRNTGIAITDAAPAGTTFVTNSSYVTGYVLTPFSYTYADDFDPAPAAYNGNDGNHNFAADWVESDTPQSPTAGNVQLVIDLGDYSVRPGDNPSGDNNVANGSIYRVAGDLSACTTLSLSYNYRRVSMETADHVYLDMSADGGNNWTTRVREITNGDDAAYQASGSIDVSSYKGNLALRFTSAYNDGGSTASRNDRVFIDDVWLTCTGNNLVPVTNQAAHAPSNLVIASDNFALDPGQSMQVTFQVLVSDPISPVGLVSINNTASVASVQQLTPSQSSTTDVIRARVGDFVWIDTNGNGVQDGSEIGLGGVTVNLRDSTGSSLLQTTTTNSSGVYHFLAAPGTYSLEFVSPNGYFHTLQDQGGNDAADSDPSAATGRTAAFTLSGGQIDNTLDAGFYQNATLGDFVWNDVNVNGIQDGGETGLGGITVNLRGATASPILQTTTTNASGAYSFSTAPGSYILEFLASGGYAPAPQDQGGNDATDSDANVATGRTGTVTVISNQTDLNVDAGFYQSATIGDLVWLDKDKDGVNDVGEPGLANVTVHLCSSNPCGTPLRTTTTDGNGQYLFAGLPADTFYVEVLDSTIPAGLTINSASHINPRQVTVLMGQTYLDADFAYINNTSTAVIGDRIWNDLNNNGIQDPGEPGIGNVTIALRSAGADGIFGTGDDLNPANATTDANGNYWMSNILPGEYRLVVTDKNNVLAGYTLTSGPQSNTDPSVPFSVAAGGAYLDGDFGYRQTTPNLYGIADRLWYDTDGSGTVNGGETGLSGITLSLLDNAGMVIATTLTAADGTFTFGGLPNGTYTIQVTDETRGLVNFVRTTPDAAAGSRSATLSGASLTGEHFGYRSPGVIGDTVFSDANGNGVQDSGEPGISGVTVVLWRDADSNGVFDSTIDTNVGSTTTDASGKYLFANNLAGTSFVSVDNSQAALTGYMATTVDQQTGSNAAGTQLDVILISSASSSLFADFGYRNPTGTYTIGDRVWEDTNADGTPDAGENGIAGVTLSLYKDNNLNGILDSGDSLMATTTSGAGGTYSFNGAADGSYLVSIPDRQNVLDGYEPTAGLQPFPVTVSGANRLDADFGYVRQPQTGAIGDTIWLDADGNGVQLATEEGIANVQVKLYRDNGDGVFNAGTDTLIGSTYTDRVGRYLFTGLPAGQYFADVDSANFTNRAALVGMSSTTSGNTSHLIALSAGETYLEADKGYRGTGYSIGDYIWSDADADGLQDAGEAGIGGVAVDLLSESMIVASTTTNPDGYYLFSGIPAAGSYAVSVALSNFAPGGALFGFAYTTGPQSVGSTYSSPIPLNSTTPAQMIVDFGFRKPNLGTIGDLVWLDKDLNGSQGAGEPGIPNITVDLIQDTNGDGLLDPDGADNLLGTSDDEPVIATTVTNSSGNYSFNGLRLDDGDGDANYLVNVHDTDNVLQGLALTSGSNPRAVTLSSGTPNNLNIDFGYDDPDLGDFIWHDANQNGIQDSGEVGIEGVLVLLYNDRDRDGVIDPGQDDLMKTTLTDANGQYLFAGLPFQSYIIKIADSNFNAGFPLQGFSRTVQDNPATTDELDSDLNLNNEMPVTPLGAKNFSLDGGWYAPVGYTVGNLVWQDANGNGYRDSAASEPGLLGVTVFLYRDLNGDGNLNSDDALIGQQTTNANGLYSFTNVPAGQYLVVLRDQNNRLIDLTWTNGTDHTNDYSQLPPYAIMVSADVDYADFGFEPIPPLAPTAVIVSDFRAAFEDGVVHVQWVTTLEVDMVGFNVYRATSPDGPRVLVNTELIPAQAPGQVSGASYEFIDSTIEQNVTYYYWLEAVETTGNSYIGPAEVTTTYVIYLPYINLVGVKRPE